MEISDNRYLPPPPSYEESHLDPSAPPDLPLTPPDSPSTPPDSLSTPPDSAPSVFGSARVAPAALNDQVREHELGQPVESKNKLNSSKKIKCYALFGILIVGVAAVASRNAYLKVQENQFPTTTKMTTTSGINYRPPKTTVINHGSCSVELTEFGASVIYQSENPYRDNDSCEIEFDCPVDQTLIYFVKQFDIEIHPTCDYDWLVVNGEKYCNGNVLPSSGILTSERISFNSDLTETGSGFSLEIQCKYNQ